MNGARTELKHQRRKKLFFRVVLSAIILVFLVLAIGVSLFFLPFLKIKEVRVSGAVSLSEIDISDRVENALAGKSHYMIPKNRFFTFSSAEIENTLYNSYKKIKTVKFTREFNNKLNVIIEEREPATILCEDRTCFFVDETGFIFEPAPFFSGGVFYKFADLRSTRPGLGQFLLQKPEMENVLKLAKLLSENKKIEEIRIKDDGIYDFFMKEGWRLIVNKASDFSEIYNNFMLSLPDIEKREASIDYIDLRFGNKIFYKYK